MIILAVASIIGASAIVCALIISNAMIRVERLRSTIAVSQLELSARLEDEIAKFRNEAAEELLAEYIKNMTEQ